MARDQERTRVIKVYSAETNDRGVINLVGTSLNVTQNDCKRDMSEISSNLSSEDWNFDLRSLVTPDSLTTVNTDDEFMFAMRDLTPSPGHLQKMNEDILPVIPIDVLLQTDEQTMPAPNPADMCEPNLIVAGTSKEAKKKKKKNKKKNKNNKQNKKANVDTKVTEKKNVPEIKEKVTDNDVKRPGRLEPIKEESETTQEPCVNTEEQQEAKNTSTGCFSFITRWFGKRRERRRKKEMAAIEARNARSEENSVLNGNRTARAGVAFFVELGNHAQQERRSRSRYTRRKNVDYA